jgi:hypothetical protein
MVQLEIKKAFDKSSHTKILEAMRKINTPPQIYN